MNRFDPGTTTNLKNKIRYETDDRRCGKGLRHKKNEFSQNVLKEVDADDYVLREDDCREDFKAGVEWEMAEAINAHWKSCPNLSKDNDLMCNHSLDCNQKCEYMRSFIRLLKE